MNLLVATKNAGKYAEITEVLSSLPVKLFSLADLGIKDDVEEHGKTHEENAVLKARYFFKKSKIPTLGEDSGICVNAFPGELGVQTRRWQGMGNASDKEWIRIFLEKMKNIPNAKRGAKFVCVSALIFDEKSYEKPLIFQGETRGFITQKLEAPLRAGIPISSCFRPNGCDKVYAALTPSKKNRVSHRGKAISRVKKFLKNLV